MEECFISGKLKTTQNYLMGNCDAYNDDVFGDFGQFEYFKFY